jgi:hypothetical protein
MSEEKDRGELGGAGEDGRRSKSASESHDKRTCKPPTNGGTSLKAILIQALIDKHPEIPTHMLSRLTVEQLLSEVVLKCADGDTLFRPRITYLIDSYSRRVVEFYIHPDSSDERS